MNSKHTMLCIGHRGAMGYEPENTIRSIKKALSLGVDWIEIDVYVVEGRLMVFHDDTLERTTNGRGLIMEQQVAYLRTLDAGQGEKIPFLEEVFDLVATSVGINIELKGPATAAATVAFVESYLSRGWPQEKVLLSSFAVEELIAVKQANPLLNLGVLVDDDVATGLSSANQLGAFSLNLPLRKTTEHAVAQAQAQGHRVLVYTVNKEHDIDRMRKMGVNGIFTDFPDRVLKGSSITG